MKSSDDLLSALNDVDHYVVAKALVSSRTQEAFTKDSNHRPQVEHLCNYLAYLTAVGDQNKSYIHTYNSGSGRAGSSQGGFTLFLLR